jgi:23S rRNA (adenine2503-C2)-methyltransferase
MRVKAWTGNEKIAKVYLAEASGGRHVEFVESVEPPIPRDRKWVLIVSTLFGCPGGCRHCDAGGSYSGKLSAGQMLFQTDYMVDGRYPGRKVPAVKFKVQFARMGEPAFNDAVLDVLEELPRRYDAPGLMPAVSTIAPRGAEGFFERLMAIKRKVYGGRFQLQFSVHTTDSEMRDWLMPPRKWDLGEIARYGERFHERGDRKITLNFALAEGMPVDARLLREHFDPDVFLVKITPVNPTYSARSSGIVSRIGSGRWECGVIDELEKSGFEVLLSIGELEENLIGSNCGQYVKSFMESGEALEEGYSYTVKAF